MDAGSDHRGGLDFSALCKAVDSLKLALEQPKDQFIRDSVIQRFEYTYELGSKLLRRYLEHEEGTQRIDQLTRRELYRLAAEKALIEDVESWFVYHRARNDTSLAYNERRAEEVYLVAAQFAPVAERLLIRLEQRHARS